MYGFVKAKLKKVPQLIPVVPVASPVTLPPL